MKDFIVTDGYDVTKEAVIPYGNVDTVIKSQKIPSSTNLIITHFANDVSDLAAWTDAGGVTWQVRINSITVLETKNQLGNTSQLRELGKSIEVRGGDLIEYIAKNPSAATNYTLLVSVKGYYGYWER